MIKNCKFLSLFCFFTIGFSFFSMNCKDIATVVVHGLGGCPNRIKNLSKNLSIGTELIVPVFDDYAGKRHKVHYSHISCGGKNDIAKIIEACHKTKKPIHLVGHSRGAMAICNAVASGKIKNKIVAMTLFCPPISVQEIVCYRIKRKCFGFMPPGWLIKFIDRYILSFLFRKYNYNQMQPINSPFYIKDKNILITVVGAERDLCVPFSSIKNLVNNFKKAGHNNVQFFSMPYGGHNSFWCKNIKKIIEVQQNIRNKLLLPSILFCLEETKDIFNKHK